MADKEIIVADATALKDPFGYLRGLKEGNKSRREINPFLDEHDSPVLNYDTEVNIATIVNAAIEDTSLVPKDIKIDDGDIPQAKNFYEWCTDDKFAGTVMIPYLEQLVWGIVVFSEYCVAEGSYLFSKEGMVRIEDFIDNPVRTGMQPLRKIVATHEGKAITSFGGLTSKRKKCLKITFGTGHTITVTPDHKVQVIKRNLEFDWVRAADLTEDHLCVAPYGNNVWPDGPAKLDTNIQIASSHKRYYKNAGRVDVPYKGKAFVPLKYVTPELSRLTGYIISDGSVSENTIGFINTDSALIDDFVYCCQSVFGYTPIVERNKRKENSTRSYMTAALHSKEAVRYLYHIGFTGGVSYDKIIPDYILRSDKETVIECLRAIFDCDGHITSSRVTITLSSVECVKQIHLLLQNLGIFGKFREYLYDHSDNEYVTLERKAGDYKNLRGEWTHRGPDSVRLYANIIGSKHSLKSKSLRRVSPRSVMKNKVGDHAVFPGFTPFMQRIFAYSKTFRKNYHDRGLSRTTFGRTKCFDINSLFASDEFVSFFAQHDPLVLKRLSRLQDLNCAFTNPVSIKDAGHHRVYDLTVPKGENFLADGVVVHNCLYCSDLGWLFDTHKVDDTLVKFESKVALLENGVCPHCGAGRSKMIHDGMNFYQELAVNAGQRSGKSAAVGGMLSPYLTHKMLKLQKPGAVYGIAASTVLHGTFVALTYAQAKETLWEFYFGALVESQWFQDYHAMLRYYGEKYGQQLFKFNDTFVQYRARGLLIYPSGPDKRVLRGRTRFLASVDEIGWFDNEADSKKVKTSAREVYDALDQSLLTIRGAADRLINAGYNDIPHGYAFNVSSPSSQGDKICELVRIAQTSEAIYGIHRPTWEVNPSLPRNCKSIVDAYKKDPIKAERNLGANPPLTANPYISNTDWIEKALGNYPNRVTLQEHTINRKHQDRATKWASIEKLGKGKKASCMALDAGYSNNSFGCVVGHMDSNSNIRVSLLIEIMPDPGIPLNYTMLFQDVLLEVVDNYNVCLVLADRWNSLKILSDLESMTDVATDQYSLKYKDIGLTKSYLESGSLILPKLRKGTKSVRDAVEMCAEGYPTVYKNKPVEHLILQILTVQDTGTHIQKGEGYTDDLWRALCLMIWGVTNEKYDEILNAPDMIENTRPSAIAVSRNASGGGKSLGTGSSRSFGGAIGVIKRGQ